MQYAIAIRRALARRAPRSNASSAPPFRATQRRSPMHLHTGPSYRLLPITGLLIFGSSCSGGESPVDSRSRKLTNALNEAPVLSPERPDAKTHSPVQLLTSPDALCTLSGDGIDQAIPIWADELGIVTFGA